MTLYTQSNSHLQPKVMDHTNIVMERLMDGVNQDWNVDGTTPVIYKAVPPSGKYWMISRMMIYFAGATPFADEKFGDLDALTNGFQIMANGTVLDTWKDNIDIQTSMYNAEGKPVYTLENRSIAGRMTFLKFGDEHGLRIDDNVNGYGINIQDDLSGLGQGRCRVQGKEYDKS